MNKQKLSKYSRRTYWDGTQFVDEYSRRDVPFSLTVAPAGRIEGLTKDEKESFLDYHFNNVPENNGNK